MKSQMFNDGVVSIYAKVNIAQPGSKPKNTLHLKIGSLRYKNRTVGMGRYWVAMQAHAKIDLVLRVPFLPDISTHDVAIPIDGKQYMIVQIQQPEDITPPVIDLSLERLEATYEVN